jgi:hypothetical protein
MYKKKDGTERSPSRLLCDNQARCGTSSCLYDEMLDRVREILRECIHDFDVRIKSDEGDSVKLHANLIKRLEAKRDELNAKEISQWEAQAHPDPSKRMPEHVFKVLNEKLLKEKEEVKQALCKAYESMPDPVDYEEKLFRFKSALDALNDPKATAAYQNKLLKDCIQRIDYKREKAYRIKRKPGEKKGSTGLPVGGGWIAPAMELDVKLKV